jgi:AraC family transcriptional regulator
MPPCPPLKLVTEGMGMNLPSGEFFGATVRHLEADGLRLTLSRYSAGQLQPWHTHEFPTFFLPLQSPLCDRRRREDCMLEPLSLVFHPTDELHLSEAGEAEVIGLNIEPSADWLARHELTAEALGGYRILASPEIRLTGLRLLAQAFFLPEAGLETLEADTVEIVSALTPERFGPPESGTPRWLRRVEGLLRETPEGRVRLREAAQEAGVHPVYLARIFRVHYGCSVGDYLRRVRVLRAAALALQPDGTLGEAAHEANFADQAHFTRQFVRETGLRPSILLKMRG